MGFKQGDKVSIVYTGRLEDGTIFDTCDKENPLEVIIGSEAYLPIFETSLIGRKQGDSFELTIYPADAYGERDEALVHVLDKALFTNIENLRIGMVLTQEVTDEEEEPVEVIVTDINNDSVTIDENHPLAGEVLHFDVTVL